jgi:hypothetical protein
LSSLACRRRAVELSDTGRRATVGGMNVEFTDRQLRETWKGAERRWRKLVAGIRPRGVRDLEKYRHDLSAELDSIRRHWGENVALRRKGVLTEPGPVEAVVKTIGDVTKIHGVKVTIATEEGDLDDDHLASYHYVDAVYSGVLKDYDAKRWNRILDQVDADLKQLPSSRIVWRFCRRRQRFHADTPPLGHVNYAGLESRADPAAVWLVGAARWVVNTWVWDGPPDKLSK